MPWYNQTTPHCYFEVIACIDLAIYFISLDLMFHNCKFYGSCQFKNLYIYIYIYKLFRAALVYSVLSGARSVNVGAIRGASLYIRQLSTARNTPVQRGNERCIKSTYMEVGETIAYFFYENEMHDNYIFCAATVLQRGAAPRWCCLLFLHAMLGLCMFLMSADDAVTLNRLGGSIYDNPMIASRQCSVVKPLAECAKHLLQAHRKVDQLSSTLRDTIHRNSRNYT